MTTEEKELLFKDLSARLPYGVKVNIKGTHTDSITKQLESNHLFGIQKSVLNVKPYLRPMSSMTKEENDIHKRFFWNHYHEWDGHDTETKCVIYKKLDNLLEFYYSHHLDYRGLIPMGLALEASEDMYK